MESLSILTPSILFVAKICILVLLIIYIVFAFVVVKQVKLMTKALQLGLGQQFMTIAYFHLGLTVFVFFLAIIIL